MSSDGQTAGTPVARARELLERHGVRPTSQRLRIAEMLLDRPRHLTAEQIQEALRQSPGRVSKATVYNTLKLFVEHGLLRPIHVDPERCVYDSMVVPHHHFQDLETGEMTDIPPDALRIEALPTPPPGMEVAGVEVVIRLRRRAA
ncbi:MAG: Fur family transcriptional regulator [Steroidobacteraceae bacterium]